MNKSRKRAVLLYMGIGAVTILLNVVAWNSTAFCDAYIKYVFPIWVNTYGRLTGLFPFSVGEILLVSGVLLVVFAAVLWLPLVLLRKGAAAKHWIFVLRAGIRRFYFFFAWVFLSVCVVMTLNCFLLYHASAFSENYFPEAEGISVTQDSFEELVAVRNFVVEECNRLSAEMERDEEGTILFHGDIGREAIASMRSLGKTYDQLDGYYPRPKPLAASDFFSQQYMCGYYFPFSMEANYNDVMYIMNKPAAICHELAHLRGYIFEDEANFIGFLACISSEDPFFVYSGYLSVLNYLDNDFYSAVGRDNEAYFAQTRILPQVVRDDVFVTDEEWERINGKALIDTEVVDKVSDTFTDTTLKVNGVRDGLKSYNRVVELLLQYYRAEVFGE